MKKVLCEIIAGLLCSFICYFIFAIIYKFIESFIPNIAFGGDKTSVFIGMFIGLPLGNVIGFILIERMLFKYEHRTFMSFIFGIIMGVIGVFFGLVLLDYVRMKNSVVIVLFVVAFFSFFGHKVACRFK